MDVVIIVLTVVGAATSSGGFVISVLLLLKAARKANRIEGGSELELHVASRRRGLKSLQEEFGDDALFIDVTPKSTDADWIQFSPYYPHGDIPVPLSPGVTAQSVEGIWQGLKMFESAGIDTSKFEVTSMKGLKRAVRRFGRVLGHQAGVEGDTLLEYIEARKAIYLPAYRWVLENAVPHLVERLRELAAERTVVLLDYETNCSIEDASRPLSHAGLVREWILTSRSSSSEILTT